jgi:hypothetical protein
MRKRKTEEIKRMGDNKRKKRNSVSLFVIQNYYSFQLRYKD